MDKFLERRTILIQELENLSVTETSKKIQLLIKIFPNKKCSYGFTDEFYQIFKEELISLFYKLLQKVEEELILLNSCYESSITLIPKSDHSVTRKLQTNIL